MAEDIFQSVAEELEYYKALARDQEETLRETNYVLEEFQQSSKELEAELEKEIDSTERRCKEIKIRNEALRQEVDEWKDKYHVAIKESNAHINQLTRQLEDLKQQTEMFIKKERELEQDNDDLERHERAAKWSLQELEIKYNASVEKTAILENEVAAKAALTEEVQRLKDELRDANVELAVMKSNQSITNNNINISSNGSSSMTNLNNMQASAGTVPLSSEEFGEPSVTRDEDSVVPSMSGRPSIGRSYDAMPSLRARLARNSTLQRSSGRLTAQGVTSSVSAVAETQTGAGAGAVATGTPQNPVRVVQDMVGRVKSLEARLVSCRSLVTPLLQPPPSYSTSLNVTTNGIGSNRSSYVSSSRGSGLSSSNSRPESPSAYLPTSPTPPHKVTRRSSSLILQQHLQQHRENMAARELREQQRRLQEEEHEREIQHRQQHLQQQQQNAMAAAPHGILSS
ncbi:NADH:ubiquinone oxidoreductase [Gryganskiella cystojenkinii]|nr:NADH:ubiquinone oxidoreductase [Gryganskiella cystojenkinii]